MNTSGDVTGVARGPALERVARAATTSAAPECAVEAAGATVASRAARGAPVAGAEEDGAVAG
ncbi:MAG TPA: hypothetical protein VFQ55_09650, partial [Casimicrobiaceae bacterium]|nr:hypothetical protein [Casimicrobiaceae bacterium]